MSENKAISSVVKHNLCTGCGTCVGICATNALQMVKDESKGIYHPELDEEKCNDCGICLKACPGHEVDFKSLNLNIFGKKPKDSLLGNYISCYTGYATDNDIRYNSASGGLVTALLIFALKEGIIDGVLVTRMKKDEPLEPEPFIARTRGEIIEASKSKYCPVPANIALKEILNSEEEKFAVVGLPCHIHGIRKAEQINKKLNERIVLHIGIICNHTPSFLATKFLLKKVGINTEEVVRLDYRGEGWPGGMSILTSNKAKTFIPHFSDIYWGIVVNCFFWPPRCILCSDKICELADVSFGDAWLPELMKDDNVGTSLIISRNEIGERILNKIALDDTIELKKVDADAILRSQSLYAVKRQFRARRNILKVFRRRLPAYNQYLPEANFLDYVHTLSLYLRVYFLSKHPFWPLIDLYRLLLSNISQYKTKITKCLS